ncbi:hypothetical protein D3C84_430850 [compost metagenome]
MLLAQNASQVLIAGPLTWLSSKLPSIIARRCARGLSSSSAVRRARTAVLRASIR